jgi:hypothetical protein
VAALGRGSSPKTCRRGRQTASTAARVADSCRHFRINRASLERRGRTERRWVHHGRRNGQARARAGCTRADRRGGRRAGRRTVPEHGRGKCSTAGGELALRTRSGAGERPAVMGSGVVEVVMVVVGGGGRASSSSCRGSCGHSPASARSSEWLVSST